MNFYQIKAGIDIIGHTYNLCDLEIAYTLFNNPRELKLDSKQIEEFLIEGGVADSISRNCVKAENYNRHIWDFFNEDCNDETLKHLLACYEITKERRKLNQKEFWSKNYINLKELL